MIENTTLSHVQRFGMRPPGLPDEIRHHPAWEALRREIYARAIHVAKNLSYDFRELLTDASNARLAGQLMWKLLKPLAPQVLIGPGMGATPLLYATALAALEEGENLQVLMVRDKRKHYNQKRWVEGHRQSAQGKRAVFMDDFMSAGSALSLVKEALKAEKVDVDLRAIALFYDTWEPLGSRQISVSVLPVLSLFTRHDVGLSRDCFDAAPPLMKGQAPDFIPAQPAWWRFGLNHSTAYPTKCVPVIAGDAVFVADDKSTLWCHDLHTGHIRWSTPSLAQPHKGVVQLLQHVDHSVVYGCYDGTITRLNAGDGAVQWRWKIDSSIHATPSVDAKNNRLFINTEQWCEGKPRGHLQCLNWQTGRLQWKLPHGWWPPGSTAYCEQAQRVYAPCNDQSLIAADAAYGALVWKTQTRGLVRGRPAVAQGRVLVATEQGYLECFDGASGSSIWSVKYGQSLWHQFLQVAGDCVLVLDGKKHVAAFDLVTGKLRWISRLRSSGCWAPIPYGRYHVVLSRQGNVAVFCPQQEVKIWEGSIPGGYHQPPAVAKGKLVAASTTSGLMAFDIHPYYDNS
jgi:outer membrane protein assembly factor BamB/orotate phosphoribosyltransferase